MWPVVSILYVMYVFDSWTHLDGLSLTPLTVLAHWIVSASVGVGHSGYVGVCLSVICIWLYFSLLSLLQDCSTLFVWLHLGFIGLLHGSTDWPCVVGQTVCLSVCIFILIIILICINGPTTFGTLCYETEWFVVRPLLWLYIIDWSVLHLVLDGYLYLLSACCGGVCVGQLPWQQSVSHNCLYLDYYYMWPYLGLM